MKVRQCASDPLGLRAQMAEDPSPGGLLQDLGCRDAEVYSKPGCRLCRDFRGWCNQPSQVCQPCWLAQVPSDWPGLGRPACFCARLPGSVGLQLGHLFFKLVVPLGNGDIR